MSKYLFILFSLVLCLEASAAYNSKRTCLRNGGKWDYYKRKCKPKKKIIYKKLNRKKSYSSSSSSRSSRSSSRASSGGTVQGSSGMYYKRTSSRKLARTDAKNKAADKCGSSYKTRISWIDNGCDRSRSSNQYKCWIRAKVTCESSRCKKRWCGTAEW